MAPKPEKKHPAAEEAVVKDRAGETSTSNTDTTSPSALPAEKPRPALRNA
jgi:hypothetical protein